jgi:hypothetical protein
MENESAITRWKRVPHQISVNINISILHASGHDPVKNSNRINITHNEVFLGKTSKGPILGIGKLRMNL